MNPCGSRIAGAAIALLALGACKSGSSTPTPSSVQASWEPVTAAVDGSPLDDVTGYQIAYGAPGAAPSYLAVNATSVTVPVTAGVWQFQVRAMSASRGPGALCAPVTVTVP